MGNSDPFVVENGGLIVIPPRYFLLGNESRRSRTLRLGQPYQDTVQALRTIARQTGVRVRGFHQMSTLEVAQRTGLTLEKSRLAQKRQSGEPFIFQNATPSRIVRFTRLAHKLGYSLQRGGRFWHISGGCDKGLAVNTLIGFYRASSETDIRTIGLGDSGNDLPMLQVVDRPILMPKPDGSFDDEVTAALPHILRSKEPGPAGWGRAVLAAIRGRKTTRSSPKQRNAPRSEAEPLCAS